MTHELRYVGPALSRHSWTAVLSSRQGRYLERDEQWIGATYTAVQQAARQGKIIVTSAGLNTWELTLWAAAKSGAPVLAVLPAAPDETDEDLQRQLDILANEFNCPSIFLSGAFFHAKEDRRSPKTDWPERDRIVIRHADELRPVSIRPDGNLEKLIQEARREGKTVNEDFRVPYQSSRKSVDPRIPAERLASWTKTAAWPYLTHWTHTFSGPWPGEKKADYYASLVENGTGNPRSALDTLRHILKEGCLRGSSFHIPQRRKVIGFTELPPAEAMNEIKYRKRFQRWSFEPYGLALDREKLRNLGARPVRYESESTTGHGDDIFVQHQTSGRSDWSAQREWRLPYDLDLTIFNKEEGCVLVPSSREKETTEAVSRWPVLALTEEIPDGIMD